MRKFDTKVQYLKYKVLREVARHAFEEADSASKAKTEFLNRMNYKSAYNPQYP